MQNARQMSRACALANFQVNQIAQIVVRSIHTAARTPGRLFIAVYDNSSEVFHMRQGKHEASAAATLLSQASHTLNTCRL